MARIPGATTKSFRIEKWLGLNEAPDGDARIKYGEAQVCRNWKVTRQGTLRRRPGSKTVARLPGPILALWSGSVGESEQLLAMTDEGLYRRHGGEGAFQRIGPLTAAGDGTIFGFDGKAYILTGTEYKVYDGSSLSDVEGYAPLVYITIPPGGGGTALEQVNKLTGRRRAWFSPDGEAAAFQLPEKGLLSIDYATDRATGAALAFTADPEAGRVIFKTAPAEGVNAIEIGWTHPEDFRRTVTAMQYCELYNGTGDNRVFLYGNGTNKLFYSGIDYSGRPRPDYFPDLHEVAVGTENTPVTGVIKHYSRLIVFKPTETYTIAHGTTTLADGTAAPVFYLTPANRALGNEAPGQVQLVLNSPRTLCAGAVYEWKNNSSYTSNLTVDERQAKRISDRVCGTLAGFPPGSCVCWDDNQEQEYYIVSGTTALVHNYAADAWYCYYNFPATCFARHNGELFAGDGSGRVRHVAARYGTDDGAPVNAYWESGSIDFGTATRWKYLCECWVRCAPVLQGTVTIRAETDRAREATEMDTGDTGQTFDFGTLAFPTLSFDFIRIAIARHLRLRIRRFTFCKLIFTAEQTSAAAGITGLSMNVVYGGESQ